VPERCSRFSVLARPLRVILQLIAEKRVKLFLNMREKTFDKSFGLSESSSRGTTPQIPKLEKEQEMKLKVYDVTGKFSILEVVASDVVEVMKIIADDSGMRVEDVVKVVLTGDSSEGLKPGVYGEIIL